MKTILIALIVVLAGTSLTTHRPAYLHVDLQNEYDCNVVAIPLGCMPAKIDKL